MSVTPVFATPTDYFNIADDSNIVLQESSGGLRKAWVEVVKSTGEFLKNDNAPKSMDFKYEYTATYRLVSGSVNITLGGIANTDYLVSGFSVQQSNKDYPQLTLNGVRYTSPGIIYQNIATINILGGFGIVDVFGHTGQGENFEATAATANGGGTLVECHDHVGNVLAAKLIQHKFDITLDVLGELPSLAEGYHESSQDSKKVNADFQTHSRAAFKYIPLDGE